MNYQDYLLQHKYSKSTIKAHELRLKHFKTWLKSYGKTDLHLHYKDLLQYAQYLQTQKQYQRQSTNNTLRTVKLYYDYLIDQGHITDNPAENLTIRGKHIKVLNNLLNEDELEDLYYSYNTEHHDSYFKATKQRDKVLLGFTLFQGITAMELSQLKHEHVQLQKGQLQIPSTRRSNRRTIKLESYQLLDLINYSTITYPYLTQRYPNHHPEYVFHGHLDSMRKIRGRILKQLKSYNNKVNSYAQLRSSLIVNWLKVHNLRKVQYLAGHRYISSTEKYVQDDLENLHHIVNTLHPIH